MQVASFLQYSRASPFLSNLRGNIRRAPLFWNHCQNDDPLIRSPELQRHVDGTMTLCNDDLPLKVPDAFATVPVSLSAQHHVRRHI
jgi:hypothetical protein